MIFLVSVIMCTHLIMKTYEKWQSSPIIITFVGIPTPIYSIPFPAVTICPQTKINKKVYNLTAYHEYKFKRPENTSWKE